MAAITQKKMLVLFALLRLSAAQLPLSDDVPRLWPAPAYQNRAFNGTDASLVADPKTFRFEVPADDILAWNVEYYTKAIFGNAEKEEGGKPLERLTITITGKDAARTPSLGMNESYELRVGSPDATLVAESVWGALRGLETFSQLFGMNGRATIRGGGSADIVIRDAPRYPWRGVMIDTARHFLPVATLNATIDALAQNKMNVLHLHLTDGEAFNVDSSKWPTFRNLSIKGAYAPALAYTAADFRAIVARGTLRGVRVVPEIDLPAHMSSWAQGYDDLITDCPSEDPHPQWPRYYSPADVTNPRLYAAIAEILEQLSAVFPDKFFHVGGDETQTNCWTANKNVSAYMKAHDLDVNGLYAEFENKYAAAVAKKNKTVVGWAEIFSTPETKPPPDAVIHVWHGNAELAPVVEAGYRGIVSSEWYLDDAGEPAHQWPGYYADDPLSYLPKNATAAQRELVLGGEAAMWNSAYDERGMDCRVWPNTAAVAERLWTPPDKLEGTDAARTRLSQHRCRMVRRGIRASPLGEDYCGDDLYVRKARTYFYPHDFPGVPYTPGP